MTTPPRSLLPLAAALSLALAGCAAMAPGAAPAFHLTSPDIAAGSTIADAFVLNGFGCKGGNGNYGGPCPPVGDKLLGKASFTATYGR